MAVVTGLEVLAQSGFRSLLGKRIGLVCNQATMDSHGVHALDRLLVLHQSKKLTVQAVFGPQHGIWGHTQDNMIEWEGYLDPRTGIPFFSLYGEHREPKPEWLHGLDVLVIDLADIGSRYYTFLWTMALCLKACEAVGLPILVLDRPNPIGGKKVEGTVNRAEFKSFVGLYPLPMRHGMTLGEVATYLKQCYFPGVQLEIEHIRNWSRNEESESTGLMWAMPSPNMPTVDTARVYPGACLLEGTNISEGRGTTRPFEIVGAPFLNSWKFADALSALKLEGVVFRPITFQPTFQKHSGEVCGGVFVHVFEKELIEPVITYIALLQMAWKQSEGKMKWNEPPYEYEEILLPIDILAGNDWLRPAIELGMAISEVRERISSELESFALRRSSSLLY